MNLTKRSHQTLITMVVLILVLATWNAEAQRVSGTISGNVKDETGALLPGATIQITNTDTGVMVESLSNDQGYYTVPNLGLGNYEVRAELPGFSPVLRSGIRLTVGREAVVDFVLKIGEITEEIMVTGEAPLVETTKGELYDLVDDAQIRDLPLNGRSFTDLAFLQAGVTTRSRVRNQYSSTGGGGAQISVAGARAILTSFLLDGTNIKDQMGVTPASASGSMLGVEGVREFSVMATNYSAEFGGAGGVISAVSKSGTNELNGSLFWYHRNDNLDASNFFSNKFGLAKPEFKRNQYGGSVGGPIVRDRTFFFGTYEGLRERLGSSGRAFTPSAEFRQRPDIDPAVRPYLDVYPLPNIPGSGDIQQYVFNESIPTDEDYFTVKVDHVLSDTDNLFVRYTFNNGEKVNSRAFDIFKEAARTRVQYTTIEENHTFSPSFFNTFRFGYNRSKGDTPNLDPGLPRTLNFFQPEEIYPDRFFGTLSVGGLSDLGVDQTDDRFQVMNLFQFTDTMRYTTGAHSLSFGADIQRTQLNAKIGSRLHGRWVFGGLEDLVENTPSQFQGLFPGTGTMRGFRQVQQGYFIQDDWRVNDRFTANLGLRWEFVTIPTEVAGRVANIRDPMDSEPTIGDPIFDLSKLNLAPRIGFAFDPMGDGTTAIRTGFGIFHQQQDYANNFTLYFQGPPFFNRFTMRPRDGATFPYPFETLDQIPSAAAGAVATKFKSTTPYVMQYNFSIQRQLWAETQLTVSYVGTRGVKITRIQPGNVSPSILCPCEDDPFTEEFDESTLAAGTRFFPANPNNPTALPARTNPNFANLDYKQSDTSANYNALQIRWNKRFSQGFQYQLSYTWGKNLDESSGLQGGSSGGQGAASMDPFDRSRDKGPSAWDVRHSFTANFTVELPGGNMTGPARTLLGGWNLSSIISLASGNPFTVRENRSNDRSRSNSYFIGENPLLRPNLRTGADNNPVVGDGRDPDRYLDASVYELQPRGTFGNLGRGTAIGPGYANVDFTLGKSFQMSEESELQFRAEFFNIFNRANFGDPAEGIFSGSACDNRSDGSACQALSNFSTIGDTSSTSRQIQLGLRYQF